jgi:hypothetical protein
MEKIELNKEKASREKKELQKKYADEQQKKERWSKFKESYYWTLMMEVLDKEIEDYKDITKTNVKMVAPKDFEELGKLTAVRMEIYEGIKKIKQVFVNK